MRRRTNVPEVVYVERGGDSGVKYLLWGAVIGGALALLYAPRNGEETRRSLQRNLWKLRAMTEEKLDELADQYMPRRGGSRAGLAGEDLEDAHDLEEFDEEDLDDAGGYAPGAPGAPGATRSAREELERRLAEARARRRAADTGGTSDVDDEEPLA
jgi:hypothetical protein